MFTHKLTGLYQEPADQEKAKLAALLQYPLEKADHRPKAWLSSLPLTKKLP